MTLEVHNIMEDEEQTDILVRLSKDMKELASALPGRQARYIVQNYYRAQKHRIVFNNQAKKIKDEPKEVIEFLLKQSKVLEGQMKAVLDQYSAAHPVGRWMRSITGIGPVLSAGFLSELVMRDNIPETAGHWQSFAGVLPSSLFPKYGEKHTWSDDIKLLCWKLGDCLIKTSNLEHSYYGKYYRNRKEYEITKNQRGDYSDQARNYLERFNYSKETETFKWLSGSKNNGLQMLSPAHIQSRVNRWLAKIFISHLHEISYWYINKKAPPAPYAMAHLSHVHYILPPNFNEFLDSQNLHK